ncbi:MAG: class B sortase [Clostridiales Family XIII bacterium]|nr:class B sortase [Clostridiales Family XIII bacterium]
MKNKLTIVLLVLCAGVFLVSAGVLLDYFLKQHKAERDFDELRDIVYSNVREDADGMLSSDEFSDLRSAYRALQESNANFIGWLRIYDTDVNYPVMQTVSNPEYYLHRDFSGNYTGSGTLFASEISDVERPSDVVIIYGHRMKDGSMFGTFNKFMDPEYCEKHRYIRFDTLMERRSYEILSVFRTAVDTGLDDEFKYYNYSDFADQEAVDGFLREIKNKEFFDTGVTAERGDEFIILSTCEYSQENGRLVIVGKRIPTANAPVFPVP